MSVERIVPTGREATESPADQETNSMAEMLEGYLSCNCLERGKIVSGIVVHVASCEIVVDVGAKCEGIVTERDLEKLPPEDRNSMQVGDEVLVYVVNTEDYNGNIILSLSRAQIANDWREAQRLLENQEVIESHVTNCNKGGVIIRIGNLRGFVPGSQLDASHTFNQQPVSPDGGDRWAALVGTPLQLKVIEVDQERNRLILSERAAVRDWRKSQRERLLSELNEGDVHQGRVINLADFGAFVDIGGIDGLVHLSELSWQRVSHPREVVQVGQEVQVYVLGVDRERQRVALSLKRLQPDPWASIEERYQEGQLVEGIITRLTKWGAFASIVGDEAIEGLIHISELDEGPVTHPRDVIQPEQVVTLRVLSVDGSRHRMALSLKQVIQGEYLDQDWQAMLAAEQPKPESSLSAALADTQLTQKSSPKPATDSGQSVGG
ncbi:MAG: S1 RNA-binding domain-containing protein [Chloroflexota bacterium]|nr:S1 RNA-binding domain-containing protein [Chloroflexota bacterium]